MTLSSSILSVGISQPVEYLLDNMISSLRSLTLYFFPLHALPMKCSCEGKKKGTEESILYDVKVIKQTRQQITKEPLPVL